MNGIVLWTWRYGKRFEAQVVKVADGQELLIVDKHHNQHIHEEIVELEGLPTVDDISKWEDLAETVIEAYETKELLNGSCLP